MTPFVSPPAPLAPSSSSSVSSINVHETCARHLREGQIAVIGKNRGRPYVCMNCDRLTRREWTFIEREREDLHGYLGRLLTLLLMVSTPSSYLVPRQNSTSQPASQPAWPMTCGRRVRYSCSSCLVLSCLVFFLSSSCRFLVLLHVLPCLVLFLYPQRPPLKIQDKSLVPSDLTILNR